MNCDYRIQKNVYIGASVRKTGGSGTVKFANEPMSGMKLIRVDKLGFRLTHPSLPTNDNSIWLDFNQFPFFTIHMSPGGVIDSELTFVESIMGTGTTNMVMIATNTDKYRELIAAENVKNSREILTLKNLNIGDNIISAMCKDGNTMTYIGTYYEVHKESKQPWKYGYGGHPAPLHHTSATIAPKRAYFAIFNGGKYTIKSFPTSNKFIKEMFRSNKETNTQFTDNSFNKRAIEFFYFAIKQKNIRTGGIRFKPEVRETYGDMDIIKPYDRTWGIICMISETKPKDYQKIAFDYAMETFESTETNLWYESRELAEEGYRKDYNRR